MYQFENDIVEILADKEKIDEICDRLAKEVTAVYENSGRRLVLVLVLKGSVCFAADLMRRIPLLCELDCMKVSSYGAGTVSTKNLQMQLDLRCDIEGADVLLLEDIVDSGRTLQALTGLLRHRGANSVRCCTFLDKPARRQVDFEADFVGMEIPDAFVVGYGLDYDEKYRNLPYVGILKPTVYEN